jgi:hypothetical protein
MTDSEINCVKCGRPLQQVLFGIQHGFVGGIREEDAEGCVKQWLVCTNPDCSDGRKNINQEPSEVNL